MDFHPLIIEAAESVPDRPTHEEVWRTIELMHGAQGEDLPELVSGLPSSKPAVQNSPELDSGMSGRPGLVSELDSRMSGGPELVSKLGPKSRVVPEMDSGLSNVMTGLGPGLVSESRVVPGLESGPPGLESGPPELVRGVYDLMPAMEEKYSSMSVGDDANLSDGIPIEEERRRSARIQSQPKRTPEVKQRRTPGTRTNVVKEKAQKAYITGLNNRKLENGKVMYEVQWER